MIQTSIKMHQVWAERDPIVGGRPNARERTAVHLPHPPVPAPRAPVRVPAAAPVQARGPGQDHGGDPDPDRAVAVIAGWEQDALAVEVGGFRHQTVEAAAVHPAVAVVDHIGDTTADLQVPIGEDTDLQVPTGDDTETRAHTGEGTEVHPHEGIGEEGAFLLCTDHVTGIAVPDQDRVLTRHIADQDQDQGETDHLTLENTDTEAHHPNPTRDHYPQHTEKLSRPWEIW